MTLKLLDTFAGIGGFAAASAIQGLDLCEGWSLDWDEINSFDGLTIFKEGELIKEGNLNSTLNLTDKPREWVSETFAENSIDICFIDGCHGSKCVYKDFRYCYSIWCCSNC